MSRYLILADDITGSSDSGVQLTRQGIETVLTFLPEPVGDKKVSYVLNTETRPLPPEVAYDRICKYLQKINLDVYSHVIKKVDSTIRGPIAHEILAVDRMYRPELIIFMPALPLLGRTTEKGTHMLWETPITQTELAKDRRNPVKEDNIQKILMSVYKEPVIHVGLNDLDATDFSKGRIYTFDAKTTEHMRNVVQKAEESKKRILWVGSSGIVDSLVEIKLTQLPAVALVGTLSGTTSNQVRFAKSMGVHVIEIKCGQDPAERSRTVQEAIETIASGRDLILASAPPSSRKEIFDPVFVQKYISVLMAEILPKVKISGMFLTGGDTAMGFLNEINAQGVQIFYEVQIGIPMTRVVGGDYHDMKVITKAGAFGEKDAIFFALRKLKEA